MQHTCWSNPPVEASLTPFLYSISQWGQTFGILYPQVLSSLPPLPQLQLHWHSQVAVPRDQGCDTWVLLLVCWYLLTCPWLPSTFFACLGGQVQRHPQLPPNLLFRGVLRHSWSPVVPNPQIKNIWSYYGHVPCDCFRLLPWPLVLHCLLLPFLTPPRLMRIAGMWFTVASCTTTYNYVIFSLRVHDVMSFTFEWRQSHLDSLSLGWSSCSDSTL